MRFFTALFTLLLLSNTAYASGYSMCRVMGVVEDVYYNKIHFRPLKVTSQVKETYDAGYVNCSPLMGKVIALYDKADDVVEEPCSVKLMAPFSGKKFRYKWKDNVQKGDMVTFDYSYYQAMAVEGPVCMKEWKMLEHVPLHPHSR
tara:strand:+ start:292094 stop:292528 length:435 start_codon:yes stop_codon:yes gene_type:complete